MHPDSNEDFKSSDEVVFIGFISSEDDIALETFSAVAQKYRQEFTFGVISDQAYHQAENIHSPTVVCHIFADGESRTLGGDFEPEALDKFISEASRRIIGDLSQLNQQRLLDVSNHQTSEVDTKLTRLAARVAHGISFWRDRARPRRTSSDAAWLREELL